MATCFGNTGITLMGEKVPVIANTQLMELDRKWKHTGDLMVCRVCGYSIIASKAHQRPAHSVGCANYHERNPWQQLREILVPNAKVSVASDD